jgi:multicomponent Na+:H+ antiporter subunit D
VAIVLGLAASVVPGLQQRTEQDAGRFRDRAAYTQLVLHGRPMKQTPQAPFAIEPATTAGWAYGFGSLAIALLGAAFGLWRARLLPRRVRELGRRGLSPPITVLKQAHSGIIGDYLLWIAIGTAVLGGVWAVTLR